ncbi:MAG: peptidoglycan endopeptidase [Bacillota bacterium]|nr:peptidoglycan endopeptidase [Bacillota bacterium]
MKKLNPAKVGIIGAIIFLFSLAFPRLSEAGTYVVKKGDSLWKIAQTYGTSVQKIQEINQIKGTLIYPGQLLRIPDSLNEQKKSNQPVQREMIPVSQQTPNPARQGDLNLITTARRFLGIPYRFGGTRPETGFDCSGFVQYVYSIHGIELPRIASSQATVGIKVTDPVPGDLVFFATQKSNLIDHVGIYVGNNAFIHASRSKGITITSLQDAWYGPRFAFARRVL